MGKMDADPYVDDQLSLFRRGREDDAFHNLLEASADIIESLSTAFSQSNDPHVQAFLLSVAWNSHNTSFIPLLKTAIASRTSEVWKEALNGLVSFASVESLNALRKALPCQDAQKQSWIMEAIEQMEAALNRKRPEEGD